MKVARTCAPASARLSLQAMRLSYFKKRFYLLIAEKYNVASQYRSYFSIEASLSKLFY